MVVFVNLQNTVKPVIERIYEILCCMLWNVMKAEEIERTIKVHQIYRTTHGQAKPTSLYVIWSTICNFNSNTYQWLSCCAMLKITF